MALIVRIIGVALLMAAAGVGLGRMLFPQSPDWPGISLLLGCVGGVIGAVAGAAREVVTALRQKPST